MKEILGLVSTGSILMEHNLLYWPLAGSFWEDSREIEELYLGFLYSYLLKKGIRASQYSKEFFMLSWSFKLTVIFICDPSSTSW